MSNFILLPETKDHPDILVAKHRLSTSIPGIRLVGRYLGLDLVNNDQGFAGSINYQQAQDLTTRLNGFALFPGYFAEFLGEVRGGISDRTHKVYDENEKRVRIQELKLIDSDITEQRTPWRGEHLDLFCFNSNGKLSVKYHKLGSNGKLSVKYHKIDSNGRLVLVEEELDPDTLMRNKGINLDDWLKNHTRQGLPRRNVSDGRSSYWPPRDNSVARFGAYSDRAFLGCSRYPQLSDPEIGVRVACAKI